MAPAGPGPGSPSDGRPWFREDPPPRRGRRRARFGRLLTLTILGAVLPGSGLLAAGRRRSGTLILATAFWAVVAAAVAVMLGLDQRLAVRPAGLRLLAAGFVAAGFAWALVIATSHLALRRGALRFWQQAVSVVLVVALMAGAMLTTATAAQYSLAQADLISTMFGGEGKAAPVLQRGATRVNVLLLGSDAGSGRRGVRPDSLIVASIDTRTGNTTLFTLPRNLQRVPFLADTPGARAWPNGFDCGDACLLNAVWQWGEENAALFPGDRRPGLTATRHAVSGALGLPLHYYAMVNLQGFEEVVDAMGGVTLNVPRPLPIGGGTDAVTGRKNPIRGYIPPGVRKLNGADALWYARSREGSDDYDRMKRQRCFLNAVVEQAEPRTLARAFPRLAKAARNNISTDIPQRELDAWVRLAYKVKKAQVRSLPFTNEVITPVDPDFPAMRALVRAALGAPVPGAKTPSSAPSGPTVPPAEVRVRVLNGTDVAGLGARAAAQLREQGFVVEEVGNAPGSYSSSVVRHAAASVAAGRTVAAAAGAGQLVPTAESSSVVTLVLGSDFTAVRPVTASTGKPAPSPSTSPAPKAAETCS